MHLQHVQGLRPGFGLKISKQCWPIVTGTFQQLIYQDKEPRVIYVTSQVLFLHFIFFNLTVMVIFLQPAIMC